ncbi:MAG: helix-turn-helix domain-containing protein [Planctomycetaceae bacterium]|nr:helix-turn-helix domain-containing protein [Planctomycetaceae bacterium]
MIASLDSEHSASIAPTLLTPDQAAAYIGMSRRWVYRAASAGEFPRPVKIGSATRWRRSDLDQWVEGLQG